MSKLIACLLMFCFSFFVTSIAYHAYTVGHGFHAFVVLLSMGGLFVLGLQALDPQSKSRS